MSTYPKLETITFGITDPFHSVDGLQSIPQWESAFHFPSDGKVRGLMLTLP